MRKLRLFCSLLAIGLLLIGCGGNDKPQYENVIDIKMSIIWNGLSSHEPDGKTDNAVASIVREKTGVNVIPTWVNGSEPDNLNRVFAIGKNMSDVIMAPYWGGGDANSAIIRQAIQDGFIIPLDDLIEEHGENLVDAYTVGVSPNFQELELNHEEFEGKKYIIPMHTPATREDLTNWGYTVYGRKDIIEDLNVDPSSINSSQAVYELAKKIAAGNYKDINGNPIITATTWQYGWSYETYLNSFKSRENFTNIIKREDGSLDWIANSELLTEEVLFMQKFISEGLFDKTAFTQTSIQALSKHITGGVALTSAHYPWIKGQLEDTLYETHPEMEYIPLGPILDANGVAAMPGTYRESGEYGFAVLIITKDCKNPEAVIKYLNYLNSDEGRKLAYFGIEGEDWVDVDGKIRYTEETLEKMKEDPRYLVNRGIESYFTYGVSRLLNNALDEAKNEGEIDHTYETVKQMYPIIIKEGTFASAFDYEFKDIEYFRNILNAMDYQTTIESAYCASTPEEALSILEQYRKNLNNRGYLAKYLEWLEERLETVSSDIIF